MIANELRKKYIEFFKSKGHVVIPSASLVPENDPSVLFNTAGMQPLVPYLIGDTHPQGNRLVDYQKCVRTGDIDEVGDDTHLTFFEMLGNWSLGDYSKQESIIWSWEFLTSKKWLGIDKNKLAFSVFEGDNKTPFDQESFDKWVELGVAKDRIVKLGKEDNWWPAGGNTVGPQGPDTEIFYWTGIDEAPKSFDTSDNHWVEIWNNVFMQFSADRNKTLTPLVKQNVDTGMGLERTTAVLQGKASVYETELFVPIIKEIERLSRKSYLDYKIEMRIIADHIRTAVMIISDGIVPANKDQGYILRRLIRRAVRQMLKLSSDKESLGSIVESSIKTLEYAYPALTEKKDKILEEIKKEEDKFYKTVDKGLKEVKKIWEKQEKITGDDAFNLYQTYGFPLELTEEIALEYGQKINREVFTYDFKKHQELSRVGAGRKFAGGLVDHSIETARLHTATHLLHQALRQVLGDGVVQKGSNINKDRLRFDFAYDKKMADEQKQEVEQIVNEQIQKNLPIICETMSVDDAKQSGAIGLFSNKYADLGGKIKVYSVGQGKNLFSKEICGGPHAKNTKELGHFRIKKEEASSAGVRRIKALLE